MAVVLALVATLIAVKLTQPPARSAPPANARTTALVQQQVTSVPIATFNSVGAGRATRLDAVTGQPALTMEGKPEVLYMGGEYCPYCAAERWALAAALSRFGTLSGLSLIRSSPTDVYANTPTLSFAKASYTSKYLAFVPVEWYGEATDPRTPTGYAYLQQPTAQQLALFATFGGSMPFVDVGNRYILPQAQFDRQGHRRRRQHHHRRHLHPYPRPAGRRLPFRRRPGGGRLDLGRVPSSASG